MLLPCVMSALSAPNALLSVASARDGFLVSGAGLVPSVPDPACFAVMSNGKDLFTSTLQCLSTCTDHNAPSGSSIFSDRSGSRVDRHLCAGHLLAGSSPHDKLCLPSYDPVDQSLIDPLDSAGHDVDIVNASNQSSLPSARPFNSTSAYFLAELAIYNAFQSIIAQSGQPRAARRRLEKWILGHNSTTRDDVRCTTRRISRGWCRC